MKINMDDKNALDVGYESAAPDLTFPLQRTLARVQSGETLEHIQQGFARITQSARAAHGIPLLTKEQAWAICSELDADFDGTLGEAMTALRVYCGWEPYGDAA